MAPKSPECVSLVFDNDPSLAVYLGGLLAPEGTVGFGIAHRHSNPRSTWAYPYLEFPVETQQNAQQLKSLLNNTGSVSPRSECNSFRLTNNNILVVPEIVRRIAPFEPSRVRMSQAMTKFVLARSMEERIQIARDNQGVNRFDGISSADYRFLTTMPNWLAGILDTRRREPKKGLKIQSEVKPLLEALSLAFSGTIEDVNREDRDTSYELELTEEATADIYNLAGPYRRLGPQSNRNLALAS